MKCNKFNSELALRGCPNLGSAAKRHISECEHCSDLFERHLALERELKSSSTQSATRMPAELRASIMKEVSNIHHIEQSRFAFNPFIKIAIGCAAALFLIMTILTREISDERATIADAAHQADMNMLLAENMRGGRAIFNASELATKGLSEELDLLKQDILDLTEKYNRFIETRLLMASND